ncbi:hypothetical protein [Patulibacter americanus]|uniref:hypothetical protein n=1 Tax=Patulibacter americanus TaxID=588672 RepID=UPI0003B304F3|nr:hypothetical protein [Patulibacter americanus]
MTAAVAARRPSVLRAVVGVLVLAVGCALLSRGAFFVARAPAECGGDAGPCPDGLGGALVGGVLAFIFVVPAGAALAVRRVPLVPAAAAALASGAIAAGVYTARFVADPVTDATVVTWIITALFGGVAVLVGLGALLSAGGKATAARAAAGSAVRDRASAATAASSPRAAPSPRPASPPRAASSPRPAPPASHGPHDAAASRPARPAAAAPPGLTAVHDLLAHGLASGALARDSGAPPASSGRDRVVELLDLHRRGVLGDDELRIALRALRPGG